MKKFALFACILLVMSGNAGKFVEEAAWPFVTSIIGEAFTGDDGTEAIAAETPLAPNADNLTPLLSNDGTPVLNDDGTPVLVDSNGQEVTPALTAATEPEDADSGMPLNLPTPRENPLAWIIVGLVTVLGVRKYVNVKRIVRGTQMLVMKHGGTAGTLAAVGIPLYYYDTVASMFETGTFDRTAVFPTLAMTGSFLLLRKWSKTLRDRSHDVTDKYRIAAKEPFVKLPAFGKISGSQTKLATAAIEFARKSYKNAGAAEPAQNPEWVRISYPSKGGGHEHSVVHHF